MLIRDVLERIDNEFPAHLDLQDQGLFALGYYHQRAARAATPEDSDDTTPVPATQQQ